jgi:cytochrome c2
MYERAIICVALLAATTPALAGGRGQAIYQRQCARCHVVGEAAQKLSPERAKAFVDLTTATQQHDEKWLRAFLQHPSQVVKQTECRAKVDDSGASEIYRFLRSFVRPARAAAAVGGHKRGGGSGETSAAVPATGTPSGAEGEIPPQSTSRTAAPTPQPQPTGMVHR